MKLIMALIAVCSIVLGEAAQSSILDDDGFFDHRAFELRFENKMTELAESEAFADRAMLIKQLSEEKTANIEIVSPSREKPCREFNQYWDRVDSVVGVGHTYLCGSCDRHHGNLASGVVVHPDGYILTNYHVLEFQRRDRALGVITRGGDVYPVTEVVASDKLNDVAMVKIEAANMSYSEIGTGIGIGDEVYAITHPDRNYFTFTKGYVSNKSVRHSPNGTIQHISVTADYARGSSGGPIFDSNGRVIGLVQSTNTVHHDRENLANVQMVWKYIVPYTAIHRMLGLDSNPAFSKKSECAHIQ